MVLKIFFWLAGNWKHVVTAIFAGVIAWQAAIVVGRWQGGRSAKTEIRQENQKLRDKADHAGKTVDTCPAGQWDRSTGKCVLR